MIPVGRIIRRLTPSPGGKVKKKASPEEKVKKKASPEEKVK